MNPPQHERAVEEAKRLLQGIKGVRSAILFGSMARGTATEDSDIDLLIDCDRAVEPTILQALFGLASEVGVEISPIFYRDRDRHRFDTQFLESIYRANRVLLGSLPSVTPVDLDLQPLRLVSYRTDRIEPRKKARLLRALDGYRTVKWVGRKRYVVERRGFLGEVGGWRAGRGAVVVPEESAEALDKLLHRFGATRIMVPIWCQRP